MDINGQGKVSQLRPLAAACKGRHVEIVNYLIDKGADVNQRVKYSETITYKDKDGCFVYSQAAFITAYFGTPDIMEVLLHNGADLMTMELNSENLLHMASRVGNIPMIEYLIQKGIPVDSQKYSGETALHFAVKSKQREAVACLLDLGADPNVTASWGDFDRQFFEGPMDKTNDKDILALLKQYGGVRHYTYGGLRDYNLSEWENYDPSWLLEAAQGVIDEYPWLADSLKTCTYGSRDGDAFIYFVDPKGSDWNHENLIAIRHPEHGRVVLDILSDNRVGAVQKIKD